MLIKQGEFSGRNNLGAFLNEKGLKGIGVEIGTHRGEYANTLLSTWKGQKLICVDPWKSYDPVQEDKLPDKGITRMEDYLRTESVVLLRHGSRADIRVGWSETVCNTVKPNSLDFVYIDGDHRYECVMADLNRWYPRIKSGGLLCGHDIVNSEWGGVQEAVLEFCEDEGLDLYLITEDQFLPWSYYIVVP